MKASTILFCALASVLTINSRSPESIWNSQKSTNRMPASEKNVSPPAKKIDPKIFDLCKYESKGEKLETDVKTLLEDKVEVLKSVEEPAKVKKDEPKVPAVVEHKSENADWMALMSQMTTMFTTQMQLQMQLQNQMMGLMLQMQTNMMFQTNQFSGYPSLTDSLSFGGNGLGMGMGIGMSPQPSPWSPYSNPYSAMPQIQRAEIPAPMNLGFDFIQTPDDLIKVNMDQTTVAL